MKPYERECYRLIQEISILIYPKCQFPGCFKPSVVGHHLYKRDRLATAFHTECVLGMCDEHHHFAHSKPREFEFYMIDKMGERYYELLRLSHTTVKGFDFKETSVRLKKLLEHLKSEF